MSYMYCTCCVPLFFGKPLVKNTFYKSFPPKKRSDYESPKSGFGFDPKNPPRVWILWIYDSFLDLPPKTQNPFLDSEIRIWIVPKQRTLFLIVISRYTINISEVFQVFTIF